MRRSLILNIIILFMAPQVMGQLKFYASISDQDIYKDDKVTYSLILENAPKPDSVTSVTFKDFLLISGPLESWGYAGYNGDIDNYFTLNFILKPRKSGTLVIPSSCIAVNGKIIKSNPVTIHVKKEKRPANAATVVTNFPGDIRTDFFKTEDHILKKGENAEDKVRRNMLLKMEISKKSCYVGEPVLVAYKLCTKLRSDRKIIKTPSFNGFSVVDLLIPENDYEREKVNGKDYNVYYIRKAQLYPLQAGEIIVDSAEVETLTDMINAESHFASKEDALQFLDAFGPSSLDPSDIITTSTLINCRSSLLTVKPLPEKNKPLSFKGAVGNFSIRAALKQSVIHINETGFIAVTIKGAGNLQMITCPDIQWPLHVESFDSKTYDETDMQTVPVSGSRTFEFPFSVDSTGTYNIPPVQFSYFDPGKETYSIIQTEPLRIDVQPALKTNISAARMAKTKALLDGLIEKRGLIVCIIALLIVSGLFVYVKLTGSKTVVVKKSEIPKPVVAQEQLRTRYSNSQNAFASAESCLHNDDCMQFYRLLYADLKNFLADKMEIFPSEITSLTIEKYLEYKNVPNEISLELKKLLEEIEWQLYTPFEKNEKLFQMYSRAQSVSQHLHQYC